MLGPAISLAASAGLLLYWRRHHGFSGLLFVLTFAAYALAIALKGVVQYLTYGTVVADFGYASVATGIYLGAQTSVFEVGLAYAFARYAVAGKQAETRDAPAFGIGLAFWENGVLLGALPLFSLAVIYLVISAGGTLASMVASQLPASYFSSLASATSSAIMGAMERISSIMAHYAWGTLCALAAATRRRRYLAAALPMGMLDATVPFAGEVNLWVFELVVLALSLLFLLVALSALRSEGVSPHRRLPTAQRMVLGGNSAPKSGLSSRSVVKAPEKGKNPPSATSTSERWLSR